MIRIGKIVATHGLQGNVILSHIINNSKWLNKEDVLFIELNKDSFIPFFVTSARSSNAGEYMISLDDTQTVEAAGKLVGKQVYVQESVLEAHAKDLPLAWIGFKIIDDAN